MKITPIDNKNNLFYIEDVYPKTLLDKLTLEYTISLPWRRENMQDDWARRLLEPTEILNEFDQHIKDRRQEIETAINFPILACDTRFWLDEPGFSMPSHLDNDAVVLSMQVYIWDDASLPGTVFYNDKQIRKEFKYKQNTGYIMINAPGQYHGMIAKVPPESYRLCSYTWFAPKA